MQFSRADGWHRGAGQTQACQGVTAARCTYRWIWTATAPWKYCANCAPHRTVKALPRNGVVISALIVTERPMAAKRLVAWPARIRAKDVFAGFEGLPGRIGVYQLFARIGSGREIILMVYFGQGRPTAGQISKANARLASVPLD